MGVKLTQENNYDCGPCVLETIKTLTHNIPMSFHQHQMQRFKKHHKEDIENGKIKDR